MAMIVLDATDHNKKSFDEDIANGQEIDLSKMREEGKVRRAVEQPM